jgi:uncharacterized protein (TIGR02145 family)
MKITNPPHHILLIMTILIISTVCCSKKNENLPELSTIDALDITFQTASCGGSISSDGGAKITGRGICWSTTQNPTISENMITDTTTGVGDYTVSFSHLPVNTPIYVRAYAINSKGISYGNEISFTLWLNASDNSVTDIDNNSYGTLKIGTQIWMKENLKVTHYQNGDPIPNLTFLNDYEWLNTNSGAFSSYEDNPDNPGKYGYLYNGYAITNSKNICPAGWHIPAKQEWEKLVDYLGGSYTAGNLLKSQTDWTSLNEKTNDMSGFSSLPGGSRLQPLPESTHTIFYGIKTNSYYWTKDEFNSTYPQDSMWYIKMMNSTEWALLDYNITKKCGLSARCIKD